MYNILKKYNRNFFIILFIALFAGTVSYGQNINYSAFGIETKDSHIPQGLKIGDKAPDFTGYDQTGKRSN